MKKTDGELSASMLESLRYRHAHCVTQADIIRDVRTGRLPHYNPKKHFPSCEHPEDPACAAPGVPEDYIRTKAREKAAKGLETPQD